MAFKVGVTPEDMPCTQDCKNRTAYCKFDGSCNLYKEWKARQIQKKQDVLKARHKAIDIESVDNTRSRNRRK